MQLLVTAYAGLEPVESPSRDAQGESTEPDTVILRLSPRFPERAPEIESGRVYRYQDEFEFSAGTHLTHAIFIEQLAGLAGYPAVSIGLSNRAFHNGAIAAKAGPFYELIDFRSHSARSARAYAASSRRILNASWPSLTPTRTS
ncbi:hypothetical protein [Burkholderia glumae]|uniref:hypothetical protein n=1 Tax=Burkholderia glumae TaxID=337 RepID=UPI00215067EC|nr:hypothetical protein [Burkholderia glumae]